MRQRGLDQDAVLDAATTLADADGYRELTLAKLAAALGVRSQSLYAHVDGIEGLRTGLALRAQAMLADALRDAVLARTGADALRSIVEAMASFALEHPGLYEASLRSPDESPELQAAVERTIAPLSAVLGSFGLAGDDLVHHYRVIWSSVHGFVTLRQAGLLSWPADPDASFDLLVQIFVDHLEASA